MANAAAAAIVLDESPVGAEDGDGDLGLRPANFAVNFARGDGLRHATVLAA